MVKPLPRKWLIHEIDYYPKTGTDPDYDKPIYGEKVKIQNVRVDLDESISNGGNDHAKSNNAIIFVDALHSNPIPVFAEESKIIFKGRTTILKRVTEVYQVHRDVIHHYELEVI